MAIFFLQHPTNNQEKDPDKKTEIPFHEDLQNITEGGEFLDDALRMKEQPFILMRAEESIAAGSPEGLL